MIFELGETIYETCNNCHAVYWVGDADVAPVWRLAGGVAACVLIGLGFALRRRAASAGRRLALSAPAFEALITHIERGDPCDEDSVDEVVFEYHHDGDRRGTVFLTTGVVPDEALVPAACGSCTTLHADRTSICQGTGSRPFDPRRPRRQGASRSLGVPRPRPLRTPG